MEAEICDYGIARFVEDQMTSFTTSKPPSFTPEYTCYEMLVEDEKGSVKADIWSFGCLVLAVSLDERGGSASP